MNGEAVVALERIIKDGVIGSATPIDIGCIPHTVGKVNPVLPPLAGALSIHTLTGFVEYVKSRVTFDIEGGVEVLSAHVVSPSAVRLERPLRAVTRQRETLAIAEFQSLLGQATPFAFGRYLDSESFIVALQTLFEDAEDRSKVLAVVGNIRDERVQTAEDDGVSQTVTGRVGITLAATLKVPNPVTLRPYRTFREVGQPDSAFVLRLRQKEGAMPECALFEADGGRWQLDAIEGIAEFLRKNLPPTVTVIA